MINYYLLTGSSRCMKDYCSFFLHSKNHVAYVKIEMYWGKLEVEIPKVCCGEDRHCWRLCVCSTVLMPLWFFSEIRLLSRKFYVINNLWWRYFAYFVLYKSVFFLARVFGQCVHSEDTKNIHVFELKSVSCFYRILTKLLTWCINTHLKEN